MHDDWWQGCRGVGVGLGDDHLIETRARKQDRNFPQLRTMKRGWPAMWLTGLVAVSGHRGLPSDRFLQLLFHLGPGPTPHRSPGKLHPIVVIRISTGLGSWEAGGFLLDVQKQTSCQIQGIL